MSREPLPTPDEAIRELTAEVAERVRRGENPAAIRAELLAEGLDSEIADHIMAQATSRPAGEWRTRVAMILSGVILVVCSLVGFAGGVWAASFLPDGGPGLTALLTGLLAVIVVVLATALGVGAGLGLTALLAKWTV